MATKDSCGNSIQVFGASQNNLKDIDVEIPINALTVISGLSGSGKSSLAFDTLYAEGQRRYVESMSAYARQFLERIQKPAVREIRGISPAISIRQKNTTRNPRSTVGTVTEIYDFLRLLYARVGTVICHGCGREVRKDTVDAIVTELLRDHPRRRIYITFPLRDSALDLRGDAPKGRFKAKDLVDNLVRQGFHRLVSRPVGHERPLSLPSDTPESLDALLELDVLVDRLVLEEASRERLTDSLEMAFAEGKGLAEVHLLPENGPEQPRTLRFSERFECQSCGIVYRPPDPRLFSFNNPYGACPTCQGFGNTMTLDRDLIIPDPRRTLRQGPVEPFVKTRYRKFQRRMLEWAEREGLDLDTPFENLPDRIQEAIWRGSRGFPGVKGFFDRLARKKYKMHVRIFIARYRGYSRCPDCDGERLRQEARDVYIDGSRITQLTRRTIEHVRGFFADLQLSPEKATIARKLLEEIGKRLEFLDEVGLSYLTLDRLTSTLSGGEMQRIHLAASLGASLAGALYVLDEPSIGLHPRDQSRLVTLLKRLRDLGNTMLVVEHERDIIEAADHVIDMGPGAGELGGHVVFAGDLQGLLSCPESLTGKYLRGEARIPTPTFRRQPTAKKLRLRDVHQNNLKHLDLDIPLGLFVCITGVSGSGKSTLVQDVLYAGLMKQRGEWKGATGQVRSIEGGENLSEVVLIDQSPIGRTPRSNPVTYIKAFDEIRKIFASLRDSQARNLTPAHFSFNVPGGRCETCQGSGVITVEMQFLADVELQCEDCGGTRYQKKVLEVTYKGKNIHDVLQLTVREAIGFFASHAALVRKLKLLQEVGLDYVRLGQSATTLSGGEAQRIKMAAYLSRKTKGRPLFILDEPTTGLHFEDISKLLRAFDRLQSGGASILVIEHNLDVVKCADWVIDLGPEGGDEGGQVVVEGTPEQVAGCSRSHTGQFLTTYLEQPAQNRTAESA